jgi:hypothetical protein
MQINAPADGVRRPCGAERALHAHVSDPGPSAGRCVSYALSATREGASPHSCSRR